LILFIYFTYIEKQYESYHIVKPLDNNIISRIGRITKKTIVFSIELPHENNHTLIEYTSIIQLFYLNDEKQSIIDHPVLVKYPQPITVDFLPISTRSIRVLIRHLCLSYIEVKAIIYHNSVNIHFLLHLIFILLFCFCFLKKIISRNQCDINKKDNSLLDITNGQCTILFDKLQPEENYTLSIRPTCPITTSSSSYIYYDQFRNFSFHTSSGLPDDSPLILTFYNNNRTLIWRNQSYLGPDYYYELFTK